MKGIVDQLIKTGSVTRGYLGVGIQDVGRDIADGVGLKDAKGAIVSNVAEDGPAGPAGIKSGDIIAKVDGDTISWTMKMTVPMPMTLDCTATIDGDTITGSVGAGAFGSFPMTGTRAA